jgi:hypothetical protein
MQNIKLISFDIGIKNMAYCILSNEKSIIDWNVIDISKENDSIIENINFCSCINKNKKICGKKAKYSKLDIFYCDKHSKMSKEWILPLKRYEKISLNKLKRLDVYNLYTELLKDNEDKLTKTIMIDKLLLFFKDKCFEKVIQIENINASEINLITLGRNMKRLLDLIQNLDITHVIIENQISPIANRMKTIQGMLAQYFIMKFDENIHISFVSSQNKLKDFAPKDVENKSSYKEHKSDAIYYTSKILTNNPTMSTGLSLFESSKKKDDLADCFLQGIWYLKHMKYLTMNEEFNLIY